MEKLQRWLELKAIENRVKEERVALEEYIFTKYENSLIKTSNTIREGNYKITIKINEKLKVVGDIPPTADVYSMKVDDKKLEKYSTENWVQRVMNKPTITIVKEL